MLGCFGSKVYKTTLRVHGPSGAVLEAEEELYRSTVTNWVTAYMEMAAQVRFIVIGV